jgi:positive regulator of sigma E activity
VVDQKDIDMEKGKCEVTKSCSGCEEEKTCSTKEKEEHEEDRRLAQRLSHIKNNNGDEW